MFADVVLGGFSGASSAWIGVREIAAFGEKLAATYPLKASEPLELAGGVWSRSGLALERVHVGLKFYPIESVGIVGCFVRLTTDLESDGRPESRSSVAVELKTTYQQLREFGESLVALASGNRAEVVLHANEA